jgi:malonyl-CoA O-methyltransferase
MSPELTPETIDKLQARRSFERAAAAYDEVAVLQRETGLRMLQRLAYIRHQPKVILDVGAGTGEATLALSRRYKQARTIALDFALPMLQRARRRGSWLRRPRCVCGDAEQLPLADRSVDLIFSNATLQWCNDLEGTFREFLRVLRPDGLLLFSTFGPDTLKELRASWAAVDGLPHVSPFADMHDIGDTMLRVGLFNPVVDVDRMRLTYREVSSLLRDLKCLGAHNVTAGRQRGLTGKGRLRAMIQAYEAYRADGRLPASYEVVYGHAWAPQQRTQDGITCVPLDGLKLGR